MASALERLQANEDDTIWRQNASMIRQLYQQERKTLKEVKAIMENERGFPVTPLSKWEVSLRRLGMKRRLKKRDWAVVYQHIRPRLQDDGKKFRRPTAVLINGTEKPLDKCWKEFRRNAVMSQGPRRGPLPPLPTGVVIRTPTPELLESTFRQQQPRSPQDLILQSFQTTLLSLQPLFETGLQPKPDPSETLKYSDYVHRLCLEGIPFTRLLEKISDTTQGALQSPLTAFTPEGSQDDQTISVICCPDSATASGRTTSWKSQLTVIVAQVLPKSESASSTDQGLRPNFDSHHYLSMVVYLLSNNMIDTDENPAEVGMSEVLEMTFTFVSRRLLVALLRILLPSIKAAWEKLLLGAQELMNKEAFRFLIRVGMDNDWLDEYHQGHEYLFSAAQMNCSDILDALIARGCRADSYPSWCYRESIILETLESGNLDCARLLIQNCDVNLEFDVGIHRSTHFAQFIMAFDETRPDHLHCLELCLKQGADVDYKIDEYHPEPQNWLFWRQIRELGLMRHWPMLIRDYIYYFHRPLFPKLVFYSETPLLFSRARALWHLDQDANVLRDYLASDLDFSKPWEGVLWSDIDTMNSGERKDRCLGILLAEQSLLSISYPKEKVCCSRLKGLSELEFDLTWLLESKELSACILYATARLVTSAEASDKEEGLHLMQWLLDRGFRVKADALVDALLDNQGAILECLASFCVDFEKEGGEALVRVVLRDKTDAAKWLLDKGAGPNSTVYQGRNAFEAATWASSLAMMKYLVERGAKLRTLEQADRPCRVLEDLFRTPPSPHSHEMFDKFQYLIEKHVTIDGPSYPSAYILEICLEYNHDQIEQRRRVFEFMLKKGARLQPGSPLAMWIATGGRHQLVQDMLDAGADPNAHSFDTSSDSEFLIRRRMTPLQAAAGIGDYALVRMLMGRGADVNRPALGKFGKTALQAICAWDPVRQEERLRKDKTIALLLDKGADVNVANLEGLTPLICATQLGDLSLAFRLLKNRAKVNMATSPGNSPWVGTALDTAAKNGRLDMVEFLLNAGALSSSAGSEGKEYDGAIQWARKEGHFVVSELICKHSADLKREWAAPPERAVETRTPQEHTLSLSLRAKSGTACPQPERFTPSDNLQNVSVLDEFAGLSYALDETMAESSITESTAEVEGMGGAEVTDMSWTRVIEELEDEAPPADTGCEATIGRQDHSTPNQETNNEKASSGLSGWLYQSNEQNWVEDEQQNADQLSSSSLAVDIFMGSSEFLSP